MAKEVPKSDQAFFDQFEPDVFWEEHGPKIMGILLAVIVIGLGLYLWQRHKTEAAREASERLSLARDKAAFESIIQNYPNSEVSAQATLKVADLLYSEQKYDEAGAKYQGFLREFPSHPLVPAAQYGLAAVLEAQGKFQDALNGYRQVPSGPSAAYLAPSAKLAAGRCAEALGQLKEARQFYEEAMAVSQGTPLHANAILRWTVVGRELGPETNAPAPGAEAPQPFSLPAAP